MLLTAIQAIINRRWKERLSSSVLNEYIASAVRYYSERNPLHKQVTVQTVANQQIINLNQLGYTDCIGIWKVLYFPSGQVYNELKAGTELTWVQTQPYRYYLTSQRVIDDIQQQDHIQALGGSYYYEKAENKLFIYPTPTSATDIEIHYWAEHVLNDEGTGYDTIPDIDLELIVGLVLADLLENDAMAAATDPDYAEGLERVSVSKIPINAMNMASEFRERVNRKYPGWAIEAQP